MPTQSTWRRCSRCAALVYGGLPARGDCSAGGQHDYSGSSDYRLEYDHPAGPGWQREWRWCNKCQLLTYAGLPEQGACPAGGQHDHAGSGNYALTTDSSNDEGSAQSDWRWCKKCQGLHFSWSTVLPDVPPLNLTSPCPGGGVHDLSGSANYRLAYDAGTPPSLVCAVGSAQQWRPYVGLIMKDSQIRSAGFYGLNEKGY